MVGEVGDDLPLGELRRREGLGREGKGELGHAGAKRLGQGGRLPAPPGPEGIDPMEPPPRPRGQTDQGKQLDQPPVPGIGRPPGLGLFR